MDAHDNNTYCDVIGISPLKDVSLILVQEIDKALVLWWEKGGRGKKNIERKVTAMSKLKRNSVLEFQ